MLRSPFYNPEKTYEENFTNGPFGAFADSVIYQLKGEPKYNFFGYELHAPFGIPAGPLINGNFVQAALDKGFDIATYKTVRSRKYPCHPWPNILAVNPGGDLTFEKAGGRLVATRDYREPLSITNSFGVPSPAPEFWQADLAKIVKNIRPGQIVVGGFQGTKKGDGDIVAYIDDFKTTARLLVETGVPALEVNLSCPNEGTAHLLCFDIERSRQVVEAIKHEIGKIPLIVKIAYYQDDKILKNFVKEIGAIVDGISAINTIAAEIVDTEGKQALPGDGRLRSGVCGQSIKWAGLEMVARLKKLREELNYSYTIIGVGGVTAPQDFFDYQTRGADIVMSATGAMWNPYLAQDIKKELGL